METLQTLGLSIYRELQLQEKALHISHGKLPHSVVQLGQIQDYKHSSNIIIQETFAEGMVICPAVLSHIFGRVSFNPGTLELVSCLCNRVNKSMPVLVCMDIPGVLWGKTWKDLVMHFFDDDTKLVTPLALNRLFFDDTGCEDSYIDGDPGGRVILTMPLPNTKVQKTDYLVCLAEYSRAAKHIVLNPAEDEEEYEEHEAELANSHRASDFKGIETKISHSFGLHALNKEIEQLKGKTDGDAFHGGMRMGELANGRTE